MKSRTRGVKYISVKRLTHEIKYVWDRVDIKTIDDRPMWHLFKEFINSLKQGNEFSRKDLFHAIYTKEAADAMRGHESTIDHYRLYATHLGYIEHIGRALYRKRFDIPVNTTSTLIESYAYNSRPWQDWFVPKSVKRKELLELCK